MPLPPLNALKAFEATARNLSVKKAAAELCVTPSAISHQIATLENALDVRLFERSHRKVQLTDAASRFYKTIERSFGDLDRAVATLKEERYLEVLRVHCEPSFAPSWLLPNLPSFLKEHPSIDVVVHATPEAADFHSNAADLEIRFGRGNWPELRSFFLFPTRITPLCSPAMRAQLSSSPQPKELLPHRLIASERSDYSWSDWFGASGINGFRTRPSLRFDRAYLSVQAAADGLGFALENVVFASKHIAAGQLTTVFDWHLGDDCGHYIVVPKRPALTPSTELFLEWLTATAAATTFEQAVRGDGTLASHSA